MRLRVALYANMVGPEARRASRVRILRVLMTPSKLSTMTAGGVAVGMAARVALGVSRSYSRKHGRELDATNTLYT